MRLMEVAMKLSIDDIIELVKNKQTELPNGQLTES